MRSGDELPDGWTVEKMEEAIGGDAAERPYRAGEAQGTAGPGRLRRRRIAQEATGLKLPVSRQTNRNARIWAIAPPSNPHRID